jgi:hypothetical protein
MAIAERSTLQRIGDVEQMVTSFRRYQRAENKADQTGPHRNLPCDARVGTVVWELPCPSPR